MVTKCLVIGANSFMGSNFVDYALANTDWTLQCTIRNSDDRLMDVVRNFPAAAGRVLTIGYSEIGDNKLALKPDIIVNFASQARPRVSLESPAETLVDNTQLMVDILEYARAVKPKLVIHISTTDVADPSTPYAASKKVQEDICNSYYRSYGIPVVIIRPTNTYGKRQTAENFIPLCVKKILNDEAIDIYGTKFSDIGSRYYIHVWDVASKIVERVIELGPLRFTPYHTEPIPIQRGAQSIRMTNLEMALFVGSTLKIPAKINLVDPPANYNPLVQTASHIVEGANTSHDSLRETIRWIADNQEWL